MRRASVILMALVSLTGCSGDDSLSVRLGDLEQVRFDAGYHFNTASLSNGVDVPFVTWTPPVSSTSRLPLVVVLHGGGQTGTYQGESVLKSLFQPALSNMRAVFVAPTSVTGHWATPNGASLVKALVSGIKDADWPIDPTQIIIVGYSAGGTGVWYLRSEYPEMASAGIAVAGDAIAGGDTPPEQPLFVVHGSLDELFSVDDVALEVASLERHGVNVRFVEVPDIGHVGFSGYIPAVSSARPWLDELLDPSGH